MENVEKVYFSTEYIKLQQFLKLANVVSQGSDAKNLILDEQVLVNGFVEVQRGKKIRENDVVEVIGFGKYVALYK